jgi:hypothetical protein
MTPSTTIKRSARWIASDDRESDAESAARCETICAGCGGEKPCQEAFFAGCVVCWDCFKSHPIAPFKSFAGSYGEWLAAIKRGAH